MLVLAELQDLRAEVAELKQHQLEAPKDDAREREAQVADLVQRNAALFGELERRRLGRAHSPAEALVDPLEPLKQDGEKFSMGSVP